MSSREPSPGHAATAQTLSRNHVVAIGAGFTRALVPRAPLLVDDFNNDVLEDKVRSLPYASRLLDWERNLHPKGHLDIERLMTRLDSLMPYDYAENAGNAANEYAFLLSELKRAFLDCLHEAREGDIHREELKHFAKYCEAYRCCCITFNYDDFLDEALAQTRSWNPYWGYGFFCQSSLDTIASFDELETNSVLRLLKLHGSINWRPKLGYPVNPQPELAASVKQPGIGVPFAPNLPKAPAQRRAPSFCPSPFLSACPDRTRSPWSPSPFVTTVSAVLP